MSNATITQPYNLASLVAESTLAGTSVSNLNTDFLGTTWVSTSTATTYVTVDLGSALTVDTIAFLSCLAGAATTIRIRSGTTLANTVAAPTFDSGGLTMFSGFTPTSGRTNSFNTITSTSAQFWRFDFASLGGLPFATGRLVMGQRFVPAIGFSFGGVRGVRDLSTVTYAPDGALFRRRGIKLRTLSLSFPIIRNLEIEQQLRPILEKVGTSEFILVTTKNAGDAYFQSGMYYARCTADMAITWAVPDGYSAKISIESLL